MRRRAPLRPADAKSEGQRLLIVVCQRSTFGAVAARARSDESTIRRYAQGKRDPHPEMRGRLQDTVGIPAGTWDEPAHVDAYGAEDEPTTTKRTPPSTRPR